MKHDNTTILHYIPLKRSDSVLLNRLQLSNSECYINTCLKIKLIFTYYIYIYRQHNSTIRKLSLLTFEAYTTHENLNLIFVTLYGLLQELT